MFFVAYGDLSMGGSTALVQDRHYYSATVDYAAQVLVFILFYAYRHKYIVIYTIAAPYAHIFL